jgi:signal transduction histidine kinase
VHWAQDTFPNVGRDASFVMPTDAKEASCHIASTSTVLFDEILTRSPCTADIRDYNRDSIQVESSMWPSQWFRPPRHLPALFVGIMVVLAVTLGWLSWRFLEQDRKLENQRIQERLETSADLIGAGLLRKIGETEAQLAELLTLSDSELASRSLRITGPSDETALVAVMNPQHVDVYPRANLLYYPFLPANREPPESSFASGELFEFQQKDYAKAVTAFRELSQSQDPQIRAGALLRLGRNLRKAKQLDDALLVYAQLAKLTGITVGGLPAELVARHARCSLLNELRRNPTAQNEAEALYADLHRGKWPLTRGAYGFYSQEVGRWFSPDAGLKAREKERLATAAAVVSLWDEWQRIRRGEGRSSGRSSLWAHDRSVLFLWRSNADRMIGLVAGSRYFEEHWLPTLQQVMERQGVRVALTDAEGNPVLGPLPTSSSQQAVRTSAETQLPWTAHVVSRDPGADQTQHAGRRRVLLLGFGLLAALLLASSYFIARAVTRELEVARVQSEFVSAVSHEFRTPLASIRQLSEMLSDGRIPNETRRKEYYEGLRRASERLYHLVEGLLDFGRMEAGVREYRFEPLDTDSLVRSVVEEFSQEISEQRCQVTIKQNNHLPRVRADQESLRRALWNLLDNAVKYSPDCKTVWVEASCENDRVAIRVRDEGLGIALHEQKQIFKKFVRASSAGAAGAKGTGLGLAMVHHIITAHGGEVRVSSQPGKGSTFTLLLPIAKE